MGWPIIEQFRGWVGKRQKLFKGLLGVAVEEAVQCIPGVGLAIKVVGELAKHGVERLGDPKQEVTDLKPAGQAFPVEQLDQINAWLQTLTTSYQGLLDRLDTSLTVRADTADLEVVRLVKDTLAQNDDLASAFAAQQVEVRRQTLSLTLVEQQLDEVLHGQHQLAASLEDLKTAFIHSPLWTDWQQFRKARPEAVAAIVQADELFLAGQRDQGVDVYAQLLKQRGVGTGTLARRLGLEYLSRGKVAPALHYYDGACKVAAAAKTLSPGLIRTSTMLNTASSRASRVAGWRCLPRGTVLNHQFRVEDEVGRGGMASVYRVVAIDAIWEQRDLALKVPAPALMQDEATGQRFLQEIKVNLKLAQQPHPAIVRTHQHVVLVDPHTGRKLYGIVMDFVAGQSLAQLLAQRRPAKQYLTPVEILGYLRPVCQALTHAHGLGIYHRDLKPHNVMAGPDGLARLMDFGIARLLQDTLSNLTETGLQPMTGIYAPPESFGGGVFDVQSDVYLLGNLLMELLTFQPKCDPGEARPDAPAAWLQLIAETMSVARSVRPKSSEQFLKRLEAGFVETTIPLMPLPRSPAVGAVVPPLMNQTASLPVSPLSKPLSLAEVAAAKKREREEIHARARQLEKQAEYAKALTELNRLPADRQEPGYADTLQQRADEVAALQKEIEEAAHNGRLTWHHHRKIERWKQLVPPKAQELDELLSEVEDIPAKFTSPTLNMPMVLVPTGTFWMGGGGGQPGDRQVTIPHDFYLGVFPVTQAQWQAVMGSNPSWFSRSGSGKDTVKGISDADLAHFPVEQISWEDVQQFLAKLNAREKGSGWTYRLPTEAEWEYACRGGAVLKEDCSYHFYLDRPGNSLSSTQANFDGNHPDGGAAKGPYLERTTKVGSYKPNKLGLYDMHGNVWEWCEDAEGSARVIRGGSWRSHASSCRAAFRRRYAPASRYDFLGCRLARVPSGGKAS